jgi:hypothetical protein
VLRRADGFALSPIRFRCGASMPRMG